MIEIDILPGLAAGRDIDVVYCQNIRGDTLDGRLGNCRDCCGPPDLFGCWFAGLFGQEEQQAPTRSKLEFNTDALRILNKRIGRNGSGIKVPLLNASSGGYNRSRARRVDTGVGYEEQVTIIKLSAVVQKDALVARRRMLRKMVRKELDVAFSVAILS